MRWLLSFISSTFFWVLIGLICLSLLIWFIGPIIAIGSYQPLVSESLRLFIIVAIFAIWLGRVLLKRYIAAQRNKELVEEIKTSQEPILKHVKKDSAISQQFNEIDSVLKSAKFSNNKGLLQKYFQTGQYLYQMPWYVVMGAAGTGKTTVLRESGLNFPLKSSFGESISGLAGTKDCDWFLTDDAVLLDTAGRLSLHDNGEEDSYDWFEFINLLKKYRPRQPINGVIVTVGLDDLLSEETDFKNITIELRKRIHEMREKFGINFPVYLIVTKLDKLKGFDEFFHDLTQEQRKSSLGFIIPSMETENDPITATISHVNSHLQEIKDNIEASYLRRLESMPNKEDKNAIFAFSNEFALVNDRLISLFKELYKSSKFEDVIQWRGIFFTSATQSGDNIDPAYNSLMTNFELTPKYNQPYEQKPSNPYSYFIYDVFANVIFNEANLADKNRDWSKRDRLLKGLGAAVLTGLGILFVAYMFNSYLANAEYLREVQAKTTDLNKKMQAIPNTRDLLQAVELANKIKALPYQEPFMDIDDPALSHRLGLYQGSLTEEMSIAAYRRALRDNVMPMISHKIDELLRESSNTPSLETYNALKAYLMLYDETHFDADFMLDWVVRNFEEDSAIQSPEQKQAVTEALQFILEQDQVTPSLPLDTTLVERKRQALSRDDISVMILNDAFAQIEEQDIDPVSFESMGGRQSRLIFTRVSGKPLTETIDPIYTKQAYVEYVLPELLKSTARLYEEEEWVLGNYASLKTSQKETLDEAKAAYFQRYISTWNVYISDIRLKLPDNLRDARNVARILSDTNNSPLKNLIQGISDNTTLNLKKQLEDQAGNVNTNLLDRLLTRAGLGGVQNTVGNIKDNYLETLKFDTPVDGAFSEFHQLTDTGSSDSAVIDDVIVAVKDLYEYLDILNIAVEKGVDLPSNDSLYRYRAEINRLPSPFRQMFDRFSVYVLNESLEEMNERISQARREAQALEDERREQQQALEDERREQQQALEEKRRAEDRALEEQRRAENQALEEEREQQAQLAQQEALAATAALKKKQADNAFNMMTERLGSITQFCRNAIDQRYPFYKHAKESIPISTFNQLFGNKGRYAAFKTLESDVMQTTGASSFDDLLLNNRRYHREFNGIKAIDPINDKYFIQNPSQVGFDFDIEFIKVDPKLEKIVLSYGNKQYAYSHGPVIPYPLSWPVNSNKGVSLIGFEKGKLVGRTEAEGDWALFRFVDKAKQIRNTNTNSFVTFSLDGKEVVLKLTPKASRNPFDTKELRRFTCV